MRVWAQNVWLKVQEPKIVTLYQTFIYLLMFLAGLSALIQQPYTIADKLGMGLATWWATMAVVGGILGMLSCPPGVWWLEKVAIPLCMGGVAVYAYTLSTLVYTQPAMKDIAVAMALMMLLHFAARYARIRKTAYDPEK